MTPVDWREHAEHCREVALTIEDHIARRVLLEAANDYSAMALREKATSKIPAYQAAAPSAPSDLITR